VPRTDQVVEVAPLSVVISTLNRPERLARCLDALFAGSRIPTEIVVVDQGDPAATAAILDGRATSSTRLIHVTQARRGLSASQNAGVRRATCPVVSIIDDDCVPDERWIEVAAKHHAVSQGPLLLGGRVLPLPAVGDRTIPLALREATEARRLPSDAMPWDLGTGGNISVTRASYLLVGGNDERLGTGTHGRAGNDLDLFRRLMRAGVEARFEPSLLVMHERATPSEFRARSWTYGFGVGACIALWLGDGDRWALRALLEWAKMRARLLQRSVRESRRLYDELRVVGGTAHGLVYGARLAAASAARKAMAPGHGTVGSIASRIFRLARHPVVVVRRMSAGLALAHRLPIGRVSHVRRLLRICLGDQAHVLVLGDPGPVRQVWPEARLDVVGGGPEQNAVTVLSQADGPCSLPQRWNCVVLDAAAPAAEMISAAVDACRPQGVVAIVCSPGFAPVVPPSAEVERVVEARSVRLVLARVLS
jgi:glycosyltransferase involved in cell wall biosynthesis